jgi:V/A-type H+-transporting ATPase subunit K
MLQVFFAILVITIVNSLTGFATAQDSTTVTFDAGTASILGISAAIAISGSTIAAGMSIKTVGTAAISALTENEGVFFKAFLVIALGEALAIYGLIVAILLWIKIP